MEFLGVVLVESGAARIRMPEFLATTGGVNASAATGMTLSIVLAFASVVL